LRNVSLSGSDSRLISSMAYLQRKQPHLIDAAVKFSICASNQKVETSFTVGP
jgi:hypothetical protein